MARVNITLLADVFLHELLHLDLVANSKNDDPNPDIRDLKIKFRVGRGKHKGELTKYTKVYGPRLAKILAGFQPWRRDVTLGQFIQRSDDSYSMFALAKYVEKTYGFYPYIPLIYDQITEMPRIPNRDRSSALAFETNDNEPITFINFTQVDDGMCPTVYENGSGEDLEIGAPHDKSLYPDSYWKQYDQWIQEIRDAYGSGDDEENMPDFLTYEGTEPGKAVKSGTKLRILCVGDSITFGAGSDLNGGDGNGYRLRLKQDLSGKTQEHPPTYRCGIADTCVIGDKVYFAGTESSGTMENGNYVTAHAMIGLECTA